MQIYVMEMPKDKRECVFSDQKPFPHTVEGYYVCRINKNPCSLSEGKCNCLFELSLMEKGK